MKDKWRIIKKKSARREKRRNIEGEKKSLESEEMTRSGEEC